MEVVVKRDILDKIKIGIVGCGIEAETVMAAIENNIVVEPDDDVKNLFAFNMSIKISNVRFDVKDIVSTILSDSAAFLLVDSKLKAWKVVLIAISTVIKYLTGVVVVLDDEMIAVVNELDRLGACKGISKEILYASFDGKFSSSKIDEILDKLVSLRSIKVQQDKVVLKEKVCIRSGSTI